MYAKEAAEKILQTHINGVPRYEAYDQALRKEQELEIYKPVFKPERTCVYAAAEIIQQAIDSATSDLQAALKQKEAEIERLREQNENAGYLLERSAELTVSFKTKVEKLEAALKQLPITILEELDRRIYGTENRRDPAANAERSVLVSARWFIDKTAAEALREGENNV